jgi:class 3 adenylate cyclase
MIGSDLLDRMRQAGLEATGQRRNVTVLFSDLSGYTALSERMDGEDLYDLVQEFIRMLVNAVYKYEGIVDKLTGDGVMALFGAPIAHENNAERALLAALDMQSGIAELSQELQERLGVELHMRVGLHSGSVVVGGIGTNLMMDYTAVGDTVNLSRRIEEAAAPDSILVSEVVYRQTRPLFEFHPAQILTLKGIDHPVAVYRVLGPKAKPGLVRGLEGLRAPMIGRDQEFEQLNQAFDAFLNRNQGQFVIITGEAGLGKSRLAAEFKTSLEQHNVRVLEGQSQAYRRTISYWIFVDVLYNYLGVNPNTSHAQIHERLIQNVYTSLGNQAGEVLPFLEHLLSLQHFEPSLAERLRYLDAGQLRQQIFLAVRDLLLAESRRSPLMLILED